MKDAQKEALFNEVKGSLFEYLVAKELALSANGEIEFQKTLDPNYLTVLAQQDRMVRQFYPEMLPFLREVSRTTALKFKQEFPGPISGVRVVGKLSNLIVTDFHEADLILEYPQGLRPVSLKLNRKNAFVNTKSGGVKSFFTQYFPFLGREVQEKFSQFVDQEFSRLAFELHALYELEYPGHFGEWVRLGLSELPGELDENARQIIKTYYARIARQMHLILRKVIETSSEAVQDALPPLLGFGDPDIIQVITFHEFPDRLDGQVQVHAFHELRGELSSAQLKPFNESASVEFSIGRWTLQIRVKPMNKFTTTAVKINCSVKIRQNA